MKSKLFTPSFIIAFIISSFSFFAGSLLMTVIPLYLANDIQATGSEIGLVLGFSSVGVLITRPFLGYTLDRFGRKTILYSAFFFGAILNLAFMFTKTVTALFIVRLFQIIPYAAATTALSTIAIDILPEDRRREGISFFTTSSSLSLAIGPGIGLALYNSNWYAWPFVISSCIAIIGLIGSFFIKIPQVNPVKSKFSLSKIFDIRVVNIAVIGGIAFLGASGMYSYSTLYAEEIGVDNATVSFAFTLFSISLLASRLVNSKVLGEKGPKLSGAFSLLLFSIGLCLFGFWQSRVGFLAAAFVLGAGMGIILPTVLSMAIELVPPNRRGVCNGIVYTGVDIGMSVGGFFFGVFSQQFGAYRGAYFLFSLIEFLSIFLFVLVTIPYYTKKKAEIQQASSVDI